MPLIIESVKRIMFAQFRWNTQSSVRDEYVKFVVFPIVGSSTLVVVFVSPVHTIIIMCVSGWKNGVRYCIIPGSRGPNWKRDWDKKVDLSIRLCVFVQFMKRMLSSTIDFCSIFHHRIQYTISHWAIVGRDEGTEIVWRMCSPPCAAAVWLDEDNSPPKPTKH